METAIIKKTGKRVLVYRNRETGMWQDEKVSWTHRTQVKPEWLYQEKDLQFVKRFFTKENEATLVKIREALIQDGCVEVHNEYETFYGVGFDKWLRDGIKDIPCKFEIITWNKWEGYPWTYFITIEK